MCVKQSAELSSWQRRVAELNNKVSELEDKLNKGEKELVKKQEECAKLQRDLRENVAQKEDQVSLPTRCIHIVSNIYNQIIPFYCKFNVKVNSTLQFIIKHFCSVMPQNFIPSHMDFNPQHFNVNKIISL